MKKRKPNDKIFDNKFNSGEIEFEAFHAPEIDHSYSAQFLDNYRNNYDVFRYEQLSEIILDLWEKSTWYNKFGKKRRIPKEYLGEIFFCIRKDISDQTYTHIEIFTGIADFFNLNYKALYDMIAVSSKIELLKELDDKYNIFNKKHITKLF